MQVNLITLFNFCFGVNHNPEDALRISSDAYNTSVLHTQAFHTPKDVLWDEIRIVIYTKIRIEKNESIYPLSILNFGIIASGVQSIKHFLGHCLFLKTNVENLISKSMLYLTSTR